MATAAIALIASGCGGETSPGIGAETIPVTAPPSTTTTTMAETTTTIDFDRPITQGTDPIGAEATIAELAEVINSMRGQTFNVSDQMARLAPFLAIATPVSAQILDFSASVTPVVDEDELQAVDSTVRFRVPQDRESIATFMKDELKAWGWNKANEGTQQIEGSPVTTLIFRRPGARGEDTELAVTISGLAGLTLIDYAYKDRFVAEGSFERLQFWQTTLRTPRSATAIESRVSTADDLGTIAVVYEFTAETTAEARELMIELQSEEEYVVGTSEGSGTTTAPLLLTDVDGRELLIDFALTGDPDTVQMTVASTFGLDPVD